MANEDNIRTHQIPLTLEELVQEMERHPELYQHLKIFQGRETSTDIPDFGKDYLVVSSDGFGVYRLESVDYQNETIVLSLIEVSTNKAVTYTLDINDEQPSCLFIRWKDIRAMVYAESIRTKFKIEDLLELNE